MSCKINSYTPTKFIVLCDVTASMGDVIEALNHYIVKLSLTVQLIFPDVKFACILYGDYDDGTLSKTSYPIYIQEYTNNINTLKTFLKESAIPFGGGDSPEAQKSAFMELIQISDKNTIVFHFTDAIPHMDYSQSRESKMEQGIFASKKWEWTWNSIVSDIKNVQMHIVTFVNKTLSNWEGTPYYNMIGKTVFCHFITEQIMKTTMNEFTELCGLNEIGGLHQYKIKFSDIKQRLYNDKKYLESAVSILIDLIKNYNIEGAIDIFNNKITCEVYRTIAPIRTNEDIRELKNKMSNLVGGKNPYSLGTFLYNEYNLKQSTLSKLLSESFNRGDAVNELVEKYLPTCNKFLIASINKVPIKDLQQFFSGFSKLEARHITIFIQRLQETTYPLNKLETFYDMKIIPTDIPDEEFFSLITHLITPGYICSKRQTAIIALLCLNDMRFKTRAHAYLSNLKAISEEEDIRISNGENIKISKKWLNLSLLKKESNEELPGFEFPENINMGLVYFLLSGHYIKYLTTREKNILLSFRTLNQIRNARDKIIEVKTAILPNCIGRIDSFTCNKCQQFCAVSLRVDGTELCAWCHTIDDNDKSCRPSNMMEKIVTCRTCNSIYTVMRPELLNVQAKCYYCRTAKSPPVICCITCKNKYIYPGYNGSEYKCHLCIDNKNEYEMNLINVVKLVEKNQIPLNNFISIPINTIVELLTNYDSVKIAQIIEIYMRNKKIADMIKAELTCDSSSITLYTLNGLHIFNSSSAINSLCTLFLSDNDMVYDIECDVCYENIKSFEAKSMCGNSKCSSRVCTSCSYEAFGNVNPGHLIEYSTCTCPYCREPVERSLIKYHPIGILKIPSNASYQSIDNIMGWCCGCNTMKIYSARVCGNDTPNITNFICTDCKPPSIVAKNVDRIIICKKCTDPLMKAMIINGVVNRGCNHLVCKCGYHVCGFEDCGEAFEKQGECYGHMMNVHKSWFEPRSYDSNVDDTDDEY